MPNPKLNILVAICTANRSAYLTNLLGRLSEIDFSRVPNSRVSILIVDNAPGGDTAEICTRAQEGIGAQLDLVEEPEPGIAEARNRAADEAFKREVDFLAFLDDDDLPDTGWLRHLAEAQENTQADIVMGNRRRPSGYSMSLTLPSEQIELWKPNGLPRLLSTCNVMISVPLLRRLASEGPIFDPFFSHMGGEDADFFMRAHLAGARFSAAPHSIIDFRVEGARSSLYGGLMRKAKGGCSQGAVARKYLDRQTLIRWFGGILWRMIRDGVLLAPELLAKRSAAKTPYKLAWSLGAVYGALGGRVSYYNKKGLTR